MGEEEKNEDTPVTEDSELEHSKIVVTEEITELLDHEDILKTIKTFKLDSDEKKIAIEFVNSHIQFLKEIVENDYKKNIMRQNVEIQDLISHVNIMLKNRDEYLFTAMIVSSPSHYRCIQTELYKQHESAKKGKGEGGEQKKPESQ